MQKILGDREIRRDLLKMGYSRITVSNALNGKMDTPAAQKIRARALQLGASEKKDEKVGYL
ncbi:hypothetical protein Barb6XT_02380 [Bacteroidales bacterium Barb6XT]|nr:hypothetical protein Barb6XT_02380 [Bacteroidales bacterium Barb6XT]